MQINLKSKKYNQVIKGIKQPSKKLTGRKYDVIERERISHALNVISLLRWQLLSSMYHGVTSLIRKGVMFAALSHVKMN